MKRGDYSVQEMNQEFSSPGGGGGGGNGDYMPWPGGMGDSPMFSISGTGSIGSGSSSSSSSSSSHSSDSGMNFHDGSFTGISFGAEGHPFMRGMGLHSYMGGGGGHSFMGGGFPGGHGMFMTGFNGFSGGGDSNENHGNGNDNGFTGIQGEIIDDSHHTPPSVFDYKPPMRGKDINNLPHILPAGGKSIEQLQEEADFQLKKLFFESKMNRESAQNQIKKLKDNYGYGTFGYDGYKSSIKYEPIDLGTHNAIDLGTSIDYTALKGHNGKLKLPVQTVRLTKTLGIHIPEPYPVKEEVPVPAPYPVHVEHGHPHPHPHSSQHFQSGPENNNHFSGDYTYVESPGKTSYTKNEHPIGSIVRYHENLPRPTLKNFKGSPPDFSNYHSNQNFEGPHTHVFHINSQNEDFLVPPAPPSHH